MYTFEVGREYEPNDANYPPIKVIKRTAKMIQCQSDSGSIFRMRIRTDAYGNEYATDSSVPRKWQDIFTYQAQFKRGGHYYGEIVMHGEHECVVTAVWHDDEANKDGITIKPTGGYGFEIDIYDEQL